MESGRPGADSGVGGNPCARNGKSPKLGPCPPAGGSLFDRWRSSVAFVQVSCRSTRRGVSGHPAPSGALRLDIVIPFLRAYLWSAGTQHHQVHYDSQRPLEETSATRTGQGAPSTIRCIETCNRTVAGSNPAAVREHQHHQVHLCPYPRRAGRGPLPKYQRGVEAD